MQRWPEKGGPWPPGVAESAKRIRLCVNSQTPVVRFKLSYFSLIEKYGGLERPVDLSMLVEGEDYEYTPGGVTAMVYPVLLGMIDRSIIADAKWVSLGPQAPPQYRLSGIDCYNVSLDEHDIPLYTNFKEGIWNEIHGLDRLRFRSEEYEAYVKYNWLSTELMLQFLDEVDLFFIHDFQQLHTGPLIGPSAPAILRWHIPFRLDTVSQDLRTLVLKCAEGFDAIIVSTRRDLEGLIHAGYRGKAYQIYPCTDPARWSQPSEAEIEKARSRFSISDNDQVLLVVGRMDRIKSQDVAITAVARLRKDFPNLKLVLVGNGSFTGSGGGGLTHAKAEKWRSDLLKLSRSLGMREQVVPAGHVSDTELKALYAMSECVLIPSKTEGFNLTTAEAWLYKKPVVVSQGAGSSELVIEGVNGYTFDPKEIEGASEKLAKVLRNPEEAIKMGERGFDSARICFVDKAIEQEAAIFEETLKPYAARKNANGSSG